MTESASAWRLPKRSIAALLCVLVLLPPLVGFVVASMRPEMYRAEADAYHRVESPEFAVTDRLLASQELKANARALAVEVGEANGMTAQQVVDKLSIDNVSIGVNDDSTVLRFHILDQDPDVALKLVQEYVDAYLRSVAPEREVPGLVDNKAELEKLEAERNDIRARLAEAVTAGDIDAQERIGIQYDRVVTEMEILVEVWNKLQPEQPVIIAEPTAASWVTDSPVEPRPLRTAAIGLFGGLVLAAAALVLLRRTTPARSNELQQ